MCYSARIKSDFARFRREYGATVSLAEFVDLYLRRRSDPKIKTPKAMDAQFLDNPAPSLDPIREAIQATNAELATRLEQDLFAQRRRLADAERALQVKVTKKATEDKRIAGNKIDAALRRLDDLRRPTLTPDDSRIFPGVWAPVIVVEDGKRVIKPMRYQCRPAGKPADYDQRFPGTYNARRDNLEGFWRQQFGYTHGVAVFTQFFENVEREGRNVVLEFDPTPPREMLVACLWSRWRAPGEPELLSFAAITDEPPPEVRAAGHDRCIIPLKSEHLDDWLSPDPKRLDHWYALLDDRDRPYYAHRLAA